MKITKAQITIRGVPREEEFGYDEELNIFGIVDRGGFSYMCYRVDEYFIPKRVVARSRANGGNFMLHVGSLWIITADELERVFKELGIW